MINEPPPFLQIPSRYSPQCICLSICLSVCVSVCLSACCLVFPFHALPHVVRSSDIVSACFALPFERRLLLGTEDGRLLLINYVTGAILDESHPHAAEVGGVPMISFVSNVSVQTILQPLPQNASQLENRISIDQARRSSDASLINRLTR